MVRPPFLKGLSIVFEIKGKMATAVCYAKVVEQEAIDQIRRMESFRPPTAPAGSCPGKRQRT